MSKPQRRHATRSRVGAGLAALLVALTSASALGRTDREPVREARWLEVIVTAYNATPGQTDEDPWVAAWNNRLTPGIKAIAVSRDLLKLGLRNGARVKIDGLPGEYVVLDKTHKRWSRRVDLFMGRDVKRALEWGKRKMRIRCVASCTDL
jgi:3D (Asp-Asp-Asp) domain-containing protein